LARDCQPENKLPETGLYSFWATFLTLALRAFVCRSGHQVTSSAQNMCRVYILGQKEQVTLSLSF